MDSVKLVTSINVLVVPKMMYANNVFGDFLLILLDNAFYANILAFHVTMMEPVNNVILFCTVKYQTVLVVNVSDPLLKIVKN